MAKINCNKHNVEIGIFDCAIFDGLPKSITPEIIFCYPPCDDGSLEFYSDHPVDYFMMIPKISIFPFYEFLGFHKKIISSNCDRKLRSELFFFNDELGLKSVREIRLLTDSFQIISFKNDTTILKCRINS